MAENRSEDSNDTMKGKFGLSGGLYKAFTETELTPMKSISAKQSLGEAESREVMSMDGLNFKNIDVEKMNSNPAMVGENKEFQVPITGMRSSNAYFNLGLAARENIESKAKKQGFDSYSDKRSKMKKMTKEEKKSVRKNK
jgi:hypothetical protein